MTSKCADKIVDPPVEPVKPVEPVTPVEPEKPVEPETPVEPVLPNPVGTKECPTSCNVCFKEATGECKKCYPGYLVTGDIFSLMCV